MAFDGFDTRAVDFFTALAKDNTKAFFDAHRDEYERSIRQPLEDLLGEAQEKYGEGKVMRANRDVRFSKNKEPYRTNAAMWAGTVGGVYLSLSTSGLEVGGGLYDPTRDQLERARAAIDSQPLAASQLTAIIQRLTKNGFDIAGPSLKTAPRGYERDHPSVELLRLKHYAALRHAPVDTSAADVRRIWKQIEPLNAWAAEFVGPALSWP